MRSNARSERLVSAPPGDSTFWNVSRALVLTGGFAFVQPRYEAMVSERLRRDNASGQNLAEIVRGLQAAIVNYATKIVGTIEHDEADTAEAARVALLPIANFRDAATVRAQRNAPDAAKSPAAPPSDGSDGSDGSDDT